MIDALRALWQPEPIIALQRIFGPAWRPVLEVLSLLGGHQLVVLALCWARCPQPPRSIPRSPVGT